MSGDMFNNPDALAAPDTHDSQISDSKIPDNNDDERYWLVGVGSISVCERILVMPHGAIGSNRCG